MPAEEYNVHVYNPKCYRGLINTEDLCEVIEREAAALSEIKAGADAYDRLLLTYCITSDTYKDIIKAYIPIYNLNPITIAFLRWTASTLMAAWNEANSSKERAYYTAVANANYTLRRPQGKQLELILTNYVNGLFSSTVTNCSIMLTVLQYIYESKTYTPATLTDNVPIKLYCCAQEASETIRSDIRRLVRSFAQQLKVLSSTVAAYLDETQAVPTKDTGTTR